MVARVVVTRTIGTKELIVRAVDRLAESDPTRYFSIPEIAEAAGTGVKTTTAWLTVLRMRDEIAFSVAAGKYWYAPLE